MGGGSAGGSAWSKAPYFGSNAQEAALDWGVATVDEHWRYARLILPQKMFTCQPSVSGPSQTLFVTVCRLW